METICIFTDTIKKDSNSANIVPGKDNLSYIDINRKTLRNWFAFVNHISEEVADRKLDEWLKNYTADETTSLFDYARRYGGFVPEAENGIRFEILSYVGIATLIKKPEYFRLRNNVRMALYEEKNMEKLRSILQHKTDIKHMEHFDRMSKDAVQLMKYITVYENSVNLCPGRKDPNFCNFRVSVEFDYKRFFMDYPLPKEKTETHEKKTVFLAGPVTKIKVKENFTEAQEYFENLGCNVINPFSLIRKGSNDIRKVLMNLDEYACYTDICLAVVKNCNLICLMPHWKDSQSANLLKIYAQINNIPVLRLESKNDHLELDAAEMLKLIS